MDPIYCPGAIPAFPGLRERRVLLRDWTYGDFPCIEEAGRDPVIPIDTTVPSPFSGEAGRAFVERQWGRQASGEGLSPAIAEAETGTAVGLIVLLHRQHPGVVGVGYWTVASRRRRGVARTALRALSRWALSLPAVARLEALVEPGNDESVGVLDGAGFRREGLLRGYLGLHAIRHDVWLYSLIRSDIHGSNGSDTRTAPATRSTAKLGPTARRGAR